MLLTLDESNNVVVTEKFLLIKDLRDLYEKHKKNPDILNVHFGILYYMYHFDSRFLWEFRDDEVKRYNAIKAFLYKGRASLKCDVMRRAMRTYKQLYNEESVSLYLTMRDNLAKLKDYMAKTTLIKPDKSDKESILIDSKEMIMLNKGIPDQWTLLDKFEKDLKEYTKANLDIYGGGSVGVYE